MRRLAFSSRSSPLFRRANRKCLQLKFQNDLSYQEISEITKLSVSHVGVLIHTALKTLRARHAVAARDFVPFNPRLAS